MRINLRYWKSQVLSFLIRKLLFSHNPFITAGVSYVSLGSRRRISNAAGIEARFIRTRPNTTNIRFPAVKSAQPLFDAIPTLSDHRVVAQLLIFMYVAILYFITLSMILKLYNLKIQKSQYLKIDKF